MLRSCGNNTCVTLDPLHVAMVVTQRVYDELVAVGETMS